MNEDLRKQLMELGLTEDQVAKLATEGVKEATDMQSLNGDDVKSLTGCGLITARKIVAAFAPAVAPATSETTMTTMGSLDVLPPVPSDEAWLSALKVGGVLKFSKETVMGTVSAALASRVGLYDLPEKIAVAMEQQAQTLEEPVGQEFYDMQNLLTRRDYSEIFAAMPGVNGKFATKTRKEALIKRMSERLWGSLNSFQQQLKQWIDAYQQAATVAGQANLAQAIAALASGGRSAAMVQMLPPTDALRDAADAVVNDINYVFAGTGIPVAMALAYDAQQIRKVLENPSLPAQVGAANREQMLRTLGVAVSSDYPRLEKSLKQFALSIIELQNVTAGDPEYQYVIALFQLGSQIPWDKLGGASEGGRSGIGSRKGQL